MSTNDKHGSSSLEANPSLNADDGIAHMTVATNAVTGTYLFDFLNGLDLIRKVFSVHGTYLTLLEANLKQFRTLFCRMLQVG